MGLEIVVNALFSNPALPTVPVLGFSDDFNRANSPTLGKTSKDQKQWMATGQIQVGITNNEAVFNSRTGRGGVFINAGTPNGVFKATFAGRGAAENPSIALRSNAAGTETLVLSVGLYAGNLHYALSSRTVAGGLALLSEKAGLDSAPGDVITVNLAGSSVKVSVNGVEIIAATDSLFAAQQHFGIYGDTASIGARWDNMSFAPA